MRKPVVGRSKASGVAATSPDRIFALGRAFQGAKALLSAVELCLFTTLAREPLDCDALRRKLEISGRGARDFFDALVALGLLERDGNGRYRNAADAELYLDSSKETYVGGELDHCGQRVYSNWNWLTLALRSGKPQNGSASSLYPTLYADEAALDNFAKGMTGGSLLVADMLATKLPWKKYKTLIDVGTAQGCLPVHIAQAHPHLTGGGFDLPQVRKTFERYVRRRRLSGRLRFYPGDFLSNPLPSADVLVLGRILHNWDLSTKQMLLTKAYDALPAGGVLVVYERMIDDDRRVNAPALLASLNMLLVSAGGFDFTARDCLGWMQKARFRHLRAEPLAVGHTAVIGTK